MKRTVVALWLVVLALLCSAPEAEAIGERAGGRLVDGSGRELGVVLLEQQDGNVAVQVDYRGLPRGTHGIHFHAVGRCDGPDFMSAGGHYNPGGRQHGLDNPNGPHAGDLPNLVADDSTSTGEGQFDFIYRATTDRVTLTPGPASLFDPDGTALVVHASADDNVTDPAGNSGGRIACAVLTMAAPGLPNTGAGGAQPPGARRQAVLLGLGYAALIAAVPALRVLRRRA